MRVLLIVLIATATLAGGNLQAATPELAYDQRGAVVGTEAEAITDVFVLSSLVRESPQTRSTSGGRWGRK